MTKLEVYDFKKLYQTIRSVEKKTNTLPAIINIKEFESWFSIILSICLGFILYIAVQTNETSISIIVSGTQNMLLYILSGLIAMLGFIVAGLAIMLSTTSITVFNKVIKENKLEYLISVFASFVYIAVIIVILIIICIMMYFILSINTQFVFWLYMIIGVLLSYLVFFTLFYVVSLLGTCINIFIFNLNHSEEDS
ncbi:hypothetical protein P4H67_03035 [Paenibacillus lautus]|uniref:hypothetical protein n=1 Tax=Paenibacillus lautus TaxID=1401 RepID=UPI002DC04674|nr:hypothetical protein [Paenibacillus lautus]MEC0305741.1 hypothetical protein [Paenibacillus lautus]